MMLEHPLPHTHFAPQDDYRLVCEDGCKPLNMYESCNLGEAPARAVVGRPAWGLNGPGKYVARRFAELAASGRSNSNSFLSRGEWPGLALQLVRGEERG